MSGNLTKRQREADELDFDMFRVVGRLLAFAETLPRSEQRPLRDAAMQFAVGRGLVRKHMHPDSREKTAA